MTHPEFRVISGAVIVLENSARWSIWLWPVLVVLFVAAALDKDGWQRWLMLAIAAMYALLWPWLLRHRTRTLRRYREALARRADRTPG